MTTTRASEAVSGASGSGSSPVVLKMAKPILVEALRPLAIEHTNAVAVEVKELPEHPWYASSEWWLVVFTAALFVATYLLFRATIRLSKDASETARIQHEQTESSLKTSQESAAAAKKSADASLLALRPWVSVAVGLREFTYRDNGDASLLLEFEVQNHGRTPALNVDISPQLTLLSPADPQPQLVLERISRLEREFPIGLPTISLPDHTPLTPTERGMTVFPGQKAMRRIVLTYSKERLEASVADLEGNRHFIPGIVVAVVYAYHSAETRAVTEFMGQILENDRNAFEIGKPVNWTGMWVREDRTSAT